MGNMSGAFIGGARSAENRIAHQVMSEFKSEVWRQLVADIVAHRCRTGVLAENLSGEVLRTMYLLATQSVLDRGC